VFKDTKWIEQAAEQELRNVIKKENVYAVAYYSIAPFSVSAFAFCDFFLIFFQVALDVADVLFYKTFFFKFAVAVSIAYGMDDTGHCLQTITTLLVYASRQFK
jgi:hypothetical protein